MSKSNHRQVVHSSAETTASKIRLPFTLVNFRTLLAEGARPDGRYTHQQLVDWMAQFWAKYNLWLAEPRADVRTEIEAAKIAQDVEMQWDMHLVNTYTVPELRQMDFSQVRLPYEWFADWLVRLDQLASPTGSE